MKEEFINAGYKGLYNGETADDIAKRKGLRKSKRIQRDVIARVICKNKRLK